MKIKALKEWLSLFDEEEEVIVFAEGHLYPILEMQNFEGKVEIGCGWCKIEDEETSPEFSG